MEFSIMCDCSGDRFGVEQLIINDLLSLPLSSRETQIERKRATAG